MKKIIFNKIICSTENKYIKKKDNKILIDFLDDDYYFIRNNKDIVCDKIEILNGLGIFFYYKNTLTKYIDKMFLEVDFYERYNTICVRDNHKNEVVVYLYYNNEFRPDDLYKDEFTFTNTKYDVGDIVYPKNVSYYRDGEQETTSIGSLVFWRYTAQLEMFKRDGIVKITEEEFKTFCASMAFIITEKVGNEFYKIKMKNVDTSMDDVISDFYYSTDKDLKTLNEIKETALKMKESLEARNK